MNALFLIAGIVAVISTVMVVTRRDPVHALLYLVVSFLSVGMVFFILGAPFSAALEVIVYAGAIMVLFVFVVIMLRLGGATPEGKQPLTPRVWAGPVFLSAVLAVELVLAVRSAGEPSYDAVVVSPHDVAVSLFGPYVLGVELASMLLLGGLVGAFHLARHIGEVSSGKGGDRP